MVLLVMLHWEAHESGCCSYFSFSSFSRDRRAPQARLKRRLGVLSKISLVRSLNRTTHPSKTIPPSAPIPNHLHTWSQKPWLTNSRPPPRPPPLRFCAPNPPTPPAPSAHNQPGLLPTCTQPPSTATSENHLGAAPIPHVNSVLETPRRIVGTSLDFKLQS